ncbi:MAG: THUMP domain-containing protein [Promethearchaeota archaeon]
MKNFNLLISTSRFNETNAKAELWFLLLMSGDEYPIILNLKIMGLFTALTSLNNRDVINKANKLLEENSNFFRYILKIIPIDYVCEANLEVINKIVNENYKLYIKQEDSFRILLKRRKNDSIQRNKFIEVIANNLDNPVNLKNPDKIIRFEILGHLCGISFHKPNEVLRVRKNLD